MDISEQEITITPDPQILQILTYLEMRPIDSLCELIDNSIDSLSESPSESGGLIVVELPSRREVEEGNAQVRIRDNGPGMTLEQLEDALRAGYSSKNRYGSLGLFGVGFNIATGKLGCQTRLVTARVQDDFAIETLVDLITLKKTGNFKVKASRIPKPQGFTNGTIIEVKKPWGTGNQNFGFMLKLISLGRPKTLALLGKIYATLLRANRVRIIVGEDSVEPHYHCVWDDSRFVEHMKHGKIPAVYRFENKVIHTYKKCATCHMTLLPGEYHCSDPSCKCSSTITQEEKISGWVGIQRYLDASHFGIDLIRNGRAIRSLEKEAFFQFQDPETGDPIVDYPIDNRDGRIIGEIHLNHVPVDPAKQNFERSSPEWKRAIEYLRGGSSLQPEKPGAENNHSPVFKLYQGYRKVRNPGKRSMTMGKWLPGSNESTALSRSEIDELKAKFDNREPGYFDDSEWWKLVEQAEVKPVAGLRMCPSCHLESPDGLEDCPHCGHIFEGKLCINYDCGQTISRSAVTCPHCGANQIPEVKDPWLCSVCRHTNSSEQATCIICSYARGTPNPLSKEGLRGISHKDESLSIKGLSINLANGDRTSPIDVLVYLTEGHIYSYHSDGSTIRLPSVIFAEGDIEIYIDPIHPLFEQAGILFEQQVASETAAFLHSYYKSQAAKNPAEHSITKLTHDILQERWAEKFSGSGVHAALESLFASIRRRLECSFLAESADIYTNLSQEEKSALATEVVRHGRDLSEISVLKENGKFVYFLRPRAIFEVFQINPKLFFDSKVWAVTFENIPEMPLDAATKLQTQIKGEYSRLLEIAIMYLEKGTGSPPEVSLAKATCKVLSAKLID